MKRLIRIAVILTAPRPDHRAGRTGSACACRTRRLPAAGAEEPEGAPESVDGAAGPRPHADVRREPGVQCTTATRSIRPPRRPRKDGRRRSTTASTRKRKRDRAPDDPDDDGAEQRGAERGGRPRRSREGELPHLPQRAEDARDEAGERLGAAATSSLPPRRSAAASAPRRRPGRTR